MRHLFRLAAATAVAGTASVATAGPVTVTVMAPASAPQTYTPPPSWQTVPDQINPGYLFETKWCVVPLHPAVDNKAAFEQVTRFCVENSRALSKVYLADSAARSALTQETSDLVEEEKRARLQIGDTYAFSARNASDWREFSSATKRQTYMSAFVRRLLANDKAKAVNNAIVLYQRDVNRRFARDFPDGIRVLPLPVYSVATPIPAPAP